MKVNKNLLICAVIIPIFLVIIGFRYTKYRQQEGEIVKKIKDLDKRIPLGGELKKIEERYRRVNSYLLDNLPSFQDMIKRAASENKINIESLEVSSRKDTDVLRETEVEVVLKATYPRFINFLKILEDVPGIKVSGLSIQGEGKSESLKIKIKLVGLVRKPE